MIWVNLRECYNLNLSFAGKYYITYIPKFFWSKIKTEKDFKKYYENPPKATQSPDNPEKIIIEYHWEKFEMDFLEILK